MVVGDDIRADRLKDAVAVLFTDPPKVMGVLPGEVEQRVVRFVETNLAVLLGYWNGEMSTREMLELLCTG